jgi:hypothetical protein
MFETMLTRPRSRALISSLIACLAACGGGGGGGSSATPAASTDFLVTDATVDELLAFTVKVTSMRPVSDSTGIAGADVLDDDLVIDLIGSSLAPRWVSRGPLPAGTFRAMRVALDPAFTTALDRAGNPVAVQHVATVFDVPFPVPATSTGGAYQQVTLDIDLALSLAGDVASPPIAFDPQGLASLTTGVAATSGIDELKGTVSSIDAAAGTFVVLGFADGDLTAPLGNVTIDPGPGALLLDDAGVAFADEAAFFAALVAGTTVVEVHGDLVQGTVVATRIEIEDAGGGASYTVKLDGRIRNVDIALNTFDLTIIEIEKGAGIAGPVLASLGNPASVQVHYDDVTTGFVIEESTPASETQLADGERVKVKFATFVAEPFEAVQIEIEDLPEFEGTITSVAGLPLALTITLDDDDPAVTSGRVDDDTTPVTVDLTSSSLFLGTHGKPALIAAQLQAGLELEIHGIISGPSNGPTITATRTKIHPGRFRGTVSDTFELQSSFDADMIDLDDPFGASVTFGSVAVNLDPGCVFRDEALAAGEFFDLFDTLQIGEALEVEVFGLGDPLVPNQIVAYEVKAKVQ